MYGVYRRFWPTLFICCKFLIRIISSTRTSCAARSYPTPLCTTLIICCKSLIQIISFTRTSCAARSSPTPLCTTHSAHPTPPKRQGSASCREVRCSTHGSQGFRASACVRACEMCVHVCVCVCMCVCADMLFKYSWQPGISRINLFACMRLVCKSVCVCVCVCGYIIQVLMATRGFAHQPVCVSVSCVYLSPSKP